MAEEKLTASQSAAVKDRGGALLVSAAAGSGKTKVLVDRLLGYLCQEGCNIDDFLVITYTNAAAAELRLKIAQAISRQLAKEPENRHLQRQMNRIYLAEISTVHAFCANLLRSYAHRLDIPADFRIAEESEAKALQAKVLENLLEQGYETQDADFLTMVEAFGYGRNDQQLSDAIMMAYDAMRCRPDMERWCTETISALDLSQYTDVGQTPWGAYILREFHEFLHGQIRQMSSAITQMQYDPAVEKAYGQVFKNNLEQLRQLLACETWDQVYEMRQSSFGRLGAVRNPEDVRLKERVSAVRKRCWEDLKRWQGLFYAPSAALLEDLNAVTPGTQALLRFAQRFEKAYSREKQRRRMLDFSDLEHLSIQLLTDHYTGKPTEIAREIANRYKEILVDEYQDSNQVQEVIFEAISKDGQNRFMVGDVKQSIYRFRLADPTLFLKKYETYPELEKAIPGGPRKILLSENFRSRPEILDACNSVFRLIMRRQVGDLDYGEAESLRPGDRPFPPLPQTAVELHCLTNSDDTDKQDKRNLEAEFVAQRISRMLQEKTLITDGEGTRPVRPGDITILMRSVSSNASVYLDALHRHGVPVVCNRGGSLLDTTEVQVLVAMLQVIDNPHQDVPLLSVLASPVFAVSPEDLAQIRRENRLDDCYTAMQAEPDRYGSFFSVLQQLRQEALWVPIHQLIDRVFQLTGMEHVFASMADGVQRRNNLLAFRGTAVSFEATGCRTLPQFLSYLQELELGGGQLPVPQSSGQDAVTILSMHKSKGLEYPIVFLCDLSRQFNMQDLRDAILVDDQLAVGCNRLDRQRFVRYPTLAKKSIERKKKKEAISEELRILYVAMTRPKDMLVMTYYSKHLQRELENLNSQLTMPLSDELCASVNNPGKWILLAALCRTEAGELFQLAGDNDVSQVSEIPWLIRLHDLAQERDDGAAMAETAAEKPVEPEDGDLLGMFAEPPVRSSTATLPSKVTATQLKGRFMDQEAAEGAVELHQAMAFRFRKPDFLRRGLTPTEKGTATHLFLQFADYAHCTTATGVEEQLHRLVLHEFLTAEQAEAVDTASVLRLFTSPLGKWLLEAKELHREFKFSLMVDGGKLDAQAAGEKVMLQGVVDCFVVEPDGITIVDFKTDRVFGNLEERAAYYSPQLEAYSEALSRIYEMPVKRKLLYFFAAGKCVEI